MKGERHAKLKNQKTKKPYDSRVHFIVNNMNSLLEYRFVIAKVV